KRVRGCATDVLLAANAGTMPSSNGSATVAPAAFRNVRRGRHFFVMNTAGIRYVLGGALIVSKIILFSIGWSRLTAFRAAGRPGLGHPQRNFATYSCSQLTVEASVSGGIRI